jgi:hypothetical protein
LGADSRGVPPGDRAGLCGGAGGAEMMRLQEQFTRSSELEKQIKRNLAGLGYDV